jgi:hypothetical protein
MSSTIILFLSGKGFDHKGRMISQIRAFPDWQLERDHDFIQWLFPSDLHSNFFANAPILTDADIEEMKESVAVQDNLKLSLDRMISFYEKNDYWITQKNHNFLRMTRILRCLWLAGRTHDYVCLSKVLDDIYIDYSEIIGSETYLYWKNANNRDFLVNHKTPVSQPVANKKTNPYDDSDDDLFNYR